MKVLHLTRDFPPRSTGGLSTAVGGMVGALAERGYFDKAHLSTLRRLNSILQGHPDMHKTPGVDMTVGSLGHGMSAGLGMAMSARMRKKDYHTWVVVGDGESQEGSIWECAMATAKWKLDNFTVILDRNHLQNDFCVDDEMPIEPVADKWRAFGWDVQDIDGHDMAQIVAALDKAETVKGKPTAIVCRTVKGKGSKMFEGKVEFHGTTPSKEELEIALKELDEAVCK